MSGKLYVLSGPSGVGKGTLAKLLLKEDSSLALSISCTTRKPRKGEVDGRDYFFLSRKEFLARKEAGDFLETDEHFGGIYGTPRSFVLKMLETKSVILEIDVKGGFSVCRALEGTGVKPVLIMVVPPDLQALKDRLRKRATESEEELEERFKRVEYELSKAGEYDFTVVNDELTEAKRRLQQIIKQTQQGEV